MKRSCSYQVGKETIECIAISHNKPNEFEKFKVYKVWIFDMKKEKIVEGDINKCNCEYIEYD